MSVRLSIKYGPIEVEYEGDQPLERGDILSLLQEVIERGQVPTTAREDVQDSHHSTAREDEKHPPLGVASIAAQMDAKTGNDLILASCLFIESTGKTSYDRTEILNAMKTATGYYKDTYRNNMSMYLVGLVKSQKLNQNGTNRYSLNQKAKKDLEAQVA